MMDLVERVARAMCAANGTIWGGPRGEDDPDFLLTKMYHMNMARAAIEASDYAALESAILTIIKAMNEYLPPTGGDKDKFINEVIGAVDNAKVNKALEVGNADRK